MPDAVWGRPIPTVDSFRDDPLYPRIERAVAAILATGQDFAPVDVLVRMERLEPARLEDRRGGRVPYLERVMRCNLVRPSRLLRILHLHTHDLKLVPSLTSYVRWGKGPRQSLRLTRTGDPRLELAYGTHFVWPGEGRFHPPAAKESRA
jgi:hypothetical protein